MKKTILFFILCSCLFSVAYSTDYYSDSNNNDPNDLNNWWTNTDNTGLHPTSFTGGNVFIIQFGHSYTTDDDWTLNALIVDGTFSIGAHTVDVAEDVAGDGDVTFTDAGTLRIGKNFSNSGTFTAYTGSTVEYYSSANNVNAKACTYYNVTLNKPVTEDLDLHGGTMNINGELKILGGELDIRSEDATGTAVVNVTGKTTISGGGIVFEKETNVTAPLINMGELELSGGQLGSWATGIATCTSLSVTGTGSRINRVSLTVSGTTAITGEVDISDDYGTKTFEGDVTVNGTWNNSSGEGVYFNSNLTVNGSFNTPTASCNFGGTNVSIGGTATNVTMKHAYINGTCTNNVATLSLKGSLTGYANGTGTFINSANCVLEIGDDSKNIGTLTADAIPNTIIYNAPEGINTQEIEPTTYYNVVIDCSDSDTRIALTGTTTVSNHLNIISGTVEMESRNYHLTGKDLTMASGAILKIKTRSSVATTPEFTGTYSLATGSIIDFWDTYTQNISGVPTYANVIFSSSGTKVLQGNLDVNGDLSITATASLDVSTNNYSVNIAGDWINSSTDDTPFYERSGTVIFDGSAAQSISTGGEKESFYNLTNANSGNTITLQNDIDVDNSLELNGDLNINGKTINLSSTASLTENTGHLTGISGQIQTTRNLKVTSKN